MINLDSEFAQSVERHVDQIELGTDAEVVVVANFRSDPWAELSLRAGLLVATTTLCVVVWSPWTIQVPWLPLELIGIGVLAGWWVKTNPLFLRFLVPSYRIRARVEEAAAAAFHTEAVHSTRGRTGILIYLSTLENRVVVLADAGIESRVPGGKLHAIRWGKTDLHQPSNLDDFLQAMNDLGEVLAEHIPPLDDNPDELSNAPRIRT